MDDVNRVAQKAWLTALRALTIANGLVSQLLAAALGTRTFMNSGAIAAASSIIAPAVGDLTAIPSPSGLFLVSATVFVRHADADTPCVFQLIRDPSGSATPIGPAVTADSSHVSKNVTVTIGPILDAPGAAGTNHEYAMRISTATDTVSVLAADEASVTVQAIGPAF